MIIITHYKLLYFQAVETVGQIIVPINMDEKAKFVLKDEHVKC